MKTLRWLLFCLIVNIVLGIYGQDSMQPSQWLMPKPKAVTENSSTFALGRPVKLTDPTASTLLASIFTVSDEASATVTVSIVDLSLIHI